MPDGLYEHDALAWAEQQAELLRRLAAGERLNALIDWPHVIEEVRDVGLSELRACQSLLQQAMVHLLKLHAWPDSPSAAHWRDEAGTFLDDAALRFTPSMRQRMELDQLYAKATRRARMALRDLDALPDPPQTCPFTLDALLAGDVEALEGSLSR
ncbi:MAG: DUF29 domain-containing protein [Alphaproteobacteria bacterium]|nr:DUF29 domain-containing protein [Alphaproteobacteria bacterium]